MQTNQTDVKRSDENVIPENNVQTPHNIKIDTPYYPVSILLHAYRRLNKAYQGNILFDTFSSEPHITSDNEEYENAAKKTLTDLQIAYTKGDLSEPLISALIAQRLPHVFTSDLPKSQGAELNLFSVLNGNQKKSLELILNEIEKRAPSVCNVQQDGQVNVSAASSHDFGVVYGLLQDVRQHFRGGKTYSTRKATDLVQNAFEDSHLVLSARSKRTEERKVRDREHKNRVFTHEAVLLHEIDGIKLNMLAEHLLSLGKKDPFPFSALNKHLGFAKAVIDEESGLPCIRLQTPVFKRHHERQHHNRIQLLKSTIRDTAEYFYNTPHAVVTQSIVTDIAEKVKTFIKSPPRPVSQEEYEDRQRQYITLDDLEEISHNDLFDTVEGLIYTHDALTIDKIADNLNVNLSQAVNRSVLFMKLEHLIDGLIDGGRLAKQGEVYKLPQKFEGTLELEVYQKTKKRDYVQALPEDWNEGLYGKIPQIILTEAQINTHDFADGDKFTVQLSYHEGNVLDMALDTKSIKRAPQITTGKSSLSYSPSQIADGLELPKNNIWVGVVTEDKGQQFFTPTLGEGETYKLRADAGIQTGAIIRAHVAPKKGAVDQIVGEFGNVSEKHAWSTVSALEAGLELEFPTNILDGVDLTVPEPDQYRKDYKDVPFITIDPDTAKDYDDAINVVETEQGFTLMVAIADVDHYVKEGSVVLEEAFKRGNSTYLPGLTIPMLPEELSNDVCSLKEDENRASLVSTIQIDHDGNVKSFDFETAVIRSRARLTYDQVQKALEGEADEKTAPLFDQYIAPALKLSEALGNAEDKRGKLFLDTAAQAIDVNDNGEYDLRLETHNESHKLIERCMIASNISAIQFLIENDSPFLVRSHGFPNEEVLNSFSDRLAECGIEIPDETSQIKTRIDNILEQAQNLESSDDKDEVINMMVRSQAKAIYENLLNSHFALQLDAYTHETSPIRRIADLYIHRLIKAVISERDGAITVEERDKVFNDFKKNSSVITAHASTTERESEDVQRRVETRHKIEWMRGNLGKIFKARINYVDGGNIQLHVTGHKIKTIITHDELPYPASNDPDSDAVYKRGDTIKVTPTEANPATGALKFAIV